MFAPDAIFSVKAGETKMQSLPLKINNTYES